MVEKVVDISDRNVNSLADHFWWIRCWQDCHEIDTFGSWQLIVDGFSILQHAKALHSVTKISSNQKLNIFQVFSIHGISTCTAIIPLQHLHKKERAMFVNQVRMEAEKKDISEIRRFNSFTYSTYRKKNSSYIIKLLSEFKCSISHLNLINLTNCFNSIHFHGKTSEGD